MKITALEEYGLRCMVLLATLKEGESITLPEISQREGLSVPYAAKLLNLLRKAGLVTAERGRNGGYVLATAPSEIPIRAVFDAMGEPLFNASHCSKFSGDLDSCIHTGDCSVRDIWSTLSKFISTYFEQISLEELASGSINRIDAIGRMKSIPDVLTT